MHAIEFTATLGPGRTLVIPEDAAIRKLLKHHGATWEPALRRWRTTLRTARQLNLENRLDAPDPPL